MGGADADPEPGSDLREGFVFAQVHQHDQGSLGGPELAARAGRVSQSKVIAWSFLQNLPKTY